MSIGRTFEESLQKAIRMVDPSLNGFQSIPCDNVDQMLTSATDERLFVLGNAMLEKGFYLFRLYKISHLFNYIGYSVDKIHELTKIDKWFLYKLENIVNTNVSFFPSNISQEKNKLKKKKNRNNLLENN